MNGLARFTRRLTTFDTINPLRLAARLAHHALLVAMMASTVGVCAAQSAPEQAELRHEYAQVNGIKLHYVSAGKGRTILFLHGFPEFWYEWRRQLPAFAAKGHRAVAFDMRGYNLSEKPAKVEEYALPILVEDVKGMLQAVSPGRKAVLVAHDWGGVVAWAFAAAHPEMLEKLIIINAPHPAVFTRELAENPKQQRASAYMNFFRSAQAEPTLSANNYAALVSGILDAVQPAGSVTEEERRAYLEAWAQPGALTGGLNYYRAAGIGPPQPGTSPAPGALTTLGASDVSVPTLVIWGEQDTALLTGCLDGLDKFVRKLTVRRIANGSHWVVHEQPDRVNRMIEAFIRGRRVPEAN